MTDNSIPSPMTMIKIDGAKIKSIRETQGLTQLYVATAVQVTTDTISRWENRRYPTIKRENGLKLAESLGVELDEILEMDEVNDQGEMVGPPLNESIPRVSQTPLNYGFKKIWPILLLSGSLLATLFSFIYFYFISASVMTYSVKRMVPSHVTVGMPFPVIIDVSGPPNGSTSLIIREVLPPGAALLATSPEASTAFDQTGEIKWLKKVTGRTIFVYLVTIKAQGVKNIVFDGTIAIGKDPGTPSRIEGDRTTETGGHHWADTNKDNSISDREILMVYEQYSDIEDIDLNLALVEEIWLGSGYRWSPATSSFKIVE